MLLSRLTLPPPIALLTSESCSTLLEKSVIQAATLQEVGTFVPYPGLWNHPLGKHCNEGHVVVGLLLATASDRHHFLQILSH